MLKDNKLLFYSFIDIEHCRCGWALASAVAAAAAVVVVVDKAFYYDFMWGFVGQQ